jgi:peptidoglycan/LPS O-acetylase OafA/YrhL
MNYRADIDGLRALAVLPVVFFHAGFDFFSGGYIGVDIFFVISGYLITIILLKDIFSGKYSLAGFYERRARRILPAYLVMMLIVTVAGYFLFLPSEFKNLAESMLSSLGFVSNIYFWKNSGYFSIQAEYSPFLHTWSLSVEEQFYIFFPIVLAMLYKVAKPKNIFTFMLVIFICSLVLSELLLSYSKSGVFYLLPTRAWELLAGSLLAMAGTRNITNNKINELVAFTGLLLILLPVFLYTKATLFPGVSAIPPVLGTLLILFTGNNNKPTFVKWLLSSRLCVAVGLVSYSLYLWHWPVFTFMKNIYGHNVTDLIVWLAIALSFALSWLSLHFVEKPYRIKRFLVKRKHMLTVGAASIVVSMLLCVFIIQQQGFPGRFNHDVIAAEAALNDSSLQRENCHVPKRNTIPYQDKCIFGDQNVKPSYAFWGDSHSVELSDALGQHLKHKEVSGIHISYSSCPPAQGFSWSSRPLCNIHNKETLLGLNSDDDIKIVFLIARYNSYQKTDEMINLMFNGFKETIVELQNAGKKVVVIYPIPRSKGVTPLDLARNLSRSINNNDYGLSIEEYYQQNIKIQPYLDDVVNATGVPVIYPKDTLCFEGKCKFYIEGVITHFDDDHLSMSGAKLFVPQLIHYIKGIENDKT